MVIDALRHRRTVVMPWTFISKTRAGSCHQALDLMRHVARQVELDVHDLSEGELEYNEPTGRERAARLQLSVRPRRSDRRINICAAGEDPLAAAEGLLRGFRERLSKLPSGGPRPEAAHVLRVKAEKPGWVLLVEEKTGATLECECHDSEVLARLHSGDRVWFVRSHGRERARAALVHVAGRGACPMRAA